MRVYQQITLLPSPETGIYFLWEKVFQQIHLALVEIKNSDNQVPVGVSFPEYDSQAHFLGASCRLFAPDIESLQKLALDKWLLRFNDYLDLTRIRDVPDRVASYAIYRRKQPKSSLERVARRKAKREGLTFEQAFSALSHVSPQQIRTPYIVMNSHSSKKRFYLFIQREVVDEPKQGVFSTYGLSQDSTVPEF